MISMFSKACEYGIRASTYIASQSVEGRRVSLKEIAEEIDSPVAFTAKILQQLSKNQIVDSVKGASGGFEIQRSGMDRIKLSEIVHAIDGDKVYMGCGLGLKQCNAIKPCPVHDKFVRIREDLREMLENTSLFEMTAGLEVGLTFLKR
jgi:Rrf2 family protein